MHIKRIMQAIPFPIFLQIIIFYTVIVLAILLFMAFITLTSIHLILVSQIKEDLYTSAKNTVYYLELQQQVDTAVFNKNNLEPLINLQIFDEHGNLYLDNLTAREKRGPIGEAPNLNQISLGEVTEIADFDDSPVYVYYQAWTDKKGHPYYLRFFATASKEKYFTDTLRQQFTTTIIAGLIIAVILGIILTERIMRPMQLIHKTLLSIDINRLEYRVPVPTKRDEIHELSVTLNEALNRLEAGAKQQKQFVNDASHELRTPITIIKGYTDMLLRWGHKDPETLEESLLAINQETEYMTQLIEHLLFLARADQNRTALALEALSTQTIIEQAYEAAKRLTTKHVIRCESDGDYTIFGDAQRLQQLLRIFIENSIKYTPEGGTIYIICQRREQDICLSVKDTGIGIAPEYHDKIFQRFYRIDTSRTKDTGGTGLGLAIAEQIAILHRATITVDSIVNEGTTMTVHFPSVEK